jgi:hypothetical protein
MKSGKKTPSLSLLALLFSVHATGAEVPAAFEYPELTVVPKASERVAMEASRERDQKWRVHAPILFPATMTILSGASLLVNGTRTDSNGDSSSFKAAPYAAMGVGLAWWAITLGVVQRQEIYQDAATEVAKIQLKNQKDQLLRERLSEEAIRRASTLASELRWISVFSNLGANAYVLASSPSKAASNFFAAGAILSSFTPLIFTHRWNRTESIHEDYKKRIYGPLTGVPVLAPTVLSDSNGLQHSPGFALQLRF